MNTKTKERALFALGVAICAGVAGISVLLEHLIPGGLLGASIIALFMGTIINSFFHPTWIKPTLKFVSKKILKVAIILLGGFPFGRYDHVSWQNDLFCNDLYLCHVLWRRLFRSQDLQAELEARQPDLRRNRDLRWLGGGGYRSWNKHHRLQKSRTCSNVLRRYHRYARHADRSGRDLADGTDVILA